MSNITSYVLTIAAISTLFLVIALGPAAIGFTIVFLFIIGVILGLLA